jgi:hypothetical protein
MSMSFDAEKEVAKLWRNLHTSQGEIGKAHYRWRKAALEVAGPDVDPLRVALKAAEITGAEIGRAMLPRLNWLKGEDAWLLALGKQIAAHWANQGAVVTLEKGKDAGELFIKWSRCPWPSYAKDYGVKMAEDVACCDRILHTLLEDVNQFFNVSYKIETLKAIPRGQGECVRRLYKA